MIRASVTLREASGRKFSITGTGLTRADAVGELKAKAKVTVGTKQGVGKVSDDLSGAETPTMSTEVIYSNANLELSNGTGKHVTLRLDNLATKYGDLEGYIILNDPDIVALADAYKDGDGNGGYVPFDGKFVR